MEEKVLFLGTVVYPMKSNKISLGFKTEKIGKDCWNGYGGGKEEFDLTLEHCAIREVEEESGLISSIENLHKIAIVDFHNTKVDGTKFISEIHFYTLTNYMGSPIETKTMITPTEFEIDNLPWSAMMPADKDWLPQALAGNKLYARVFYGPFQKELLKPTEIFPYGEYYNRKAAQ